MNIFRGIRIVDLSRVFSGPFATRHFADSGAEVIKIEPPKGDESLNFPPLKNGWSGYYELLNRGKQVARLDLLKSADLCTLYSLCKHADVFVENYSAGVTGRLCIDYDTIRAINPRIIYASLRGVSESIDRKYYDVIAQAESGLISLNGQTEDMKNATAVVDAFTGMKLAYAISSALYYRSLHDCGMRISVSMLGSAFDLLEQNLIETSVTGHNPIKAGNMDTAIAPFGIFRTKDGSVVVACGNDTLWGKLADFVRIPPEQRRKLFGTNAERIRNIKSLTTYIETAFAAYTTNDVCMHLERLNIPYGKVARMSDVIADKRNYTAGLLKKRNIPRVGSITEPTGGITFTRHTV